ncbi:glycerophosphodiester phosphodiesterase family protein [uncultured Psychroserpens sp.]|uniref:glycerophosphodiester phosphodiesterase family protein n=1 Tax=uncultured Psychroserpens sp. TaxID=255436 RepID=UPI0026363102|nr:glycerophosphodiester phosphodiesterase family protein [uncultured Psychroserpens sp.]
MRYLWLFCFVLLAGCSSKTTLDVQGHRGCRGLHPENSLPAFKRAIDIGVQTLELDVVISKDFEVVVSHEPFMNHEIALDVFGNEISQNNEKQFNMFQMTYDSIKLYDCGSKGHTNFPLQAKEKVYKPLLKDVIDFAEKSSEQSIYYNIEIKSRPEYDNIYSPAVETFVKLVLDDIFSKQIEDRVTIQSFDLRALELTKQTNDEISIALLVDENEDISTKLSRLSFSPEIISPYFKLLNQDTVKTFQDKGFAIIPWTVNDVGDINLMIDLNVDGIISDYPNRVIQLLRLKK